MESGKTLNSSSDCLPWPDYEKNTLDESQPLMLEPLFIKRIPLWKRVFDIAGSACGMIMLFPLFLVIGIFIKTVSKGPIFFKQKRIGCGGRKFDLYKFRTMKLNADSNIHKLYLAELIDSSKASSNKGDPMTKLHKDPRIIKWGAFLRASGLDELPQLINVFLGHMSLVGPRPPIPYEAEQYRLWYKSRFDVVPGLTGLWQVSGKNKLGFNEMIRLDIQYAMNRSFLLDLKIIFKTPYAVFIQIKEMKKGRN